MFSDSFFNIKQFILLVNLQIPIMMDIKQFHHINGSIYNSSIYIVKDDDLS